MYTTKLYNQQFYVSNMSGRGTRMIGDIVSAYGMLIVGAHKHTYFYLLIPSRV